MEQGQWGPPQEGQPAGLNATLGFKVWFSWSRGSGAHLKKGSPRGLNATLGFKVWFSWSRGSGAHLRRAARGG